MFDLERQIIIAQITFSLIIIISIFVGTHFVKFRYHPNLPKKNKKSNH